MAEYTPRNMPEITVEFDYSPAEDQTRWDPGCPAEVEITEIRINEELISEDLKEDLIDLFGEEWETDIIDQYRKPKTSLFA